MGNYSIFYYSQALVNFKIEDGNRGESAAGTSQQVMFPSSAMHDNMYYVWMRSLKE